MDNQVGEQSQKYAAWYSVKVLDVLRKFSVIPLLCGIATVGLRDVDDLPVHRSLDEAHDSNKDALPNKDEFNQKNHRQTNQHDWKGYNECKWKDDQCW